MKKIYFLALALCGLSLNAQISDDFESYNTGYYFGGHWSNWSGVSSSEDIIVSTDQAYSGTKSGYIGGDGTQDVILKLGNKFNGQWTFEQKMYIPTNTSAYFNFQEDEVVTSGIWGIEHYFSYIANAFPDNTSFMVATDENDQAVYLAGYDVPYDTWFTMKFEFDMDEGNVTAYLDGDVVYSGNAYLESFQLGGVDYYSADPSNSLYIDDISFVEGFTSGLNELSNASIAVYPTVVKDNFTVSAKSNINEVSVYNTAGQQVLKVNPQGTNAQINASSLPAGVYVVKTVVGKEVKTTKVVVK